MAQNSYTNTSKQSNRVTNSDGTFTQTFNRDGNTVTWHQDQNGRLISESVKPGTTPGLYTSNTSKDTRTTTATTNDGKSYTFSGDDWISYARDNNISSQLNRAITYPSYTNAESAYSHMNEVADMYGMNVDTGGNRGYGGYGGNGYYSPVKSELPKFVDYDIDKYIDGAMNDYTSAINAQKKADMDFYNYQRGLINDRYDTLARQNYINHYLSNKNIADGLRAMGIKSGAAESTLLRSNADFQNLYSKNEDDRINALNDLYFNQAKNNSSYARDLGEFGANLNLTALKAYQNAVDAENDYNRWKADTMDERYRFNVNNTYKNAAMAYEQSERERRAYYDELDAALTAYDIEKLKEYGYDTSYIESERRAKMARNAKV